MTNSRAEKLKAGLLLGVGGVILTVALALGPTPEADDWRMFYSAAQHVFTGEPLYGPVHPFTIYPYPPWLAVILSPLGWLPMRWGWAVFGVISLGLTAALCRRWLTGWVRPALVLLSPPVLYILLHGQMDALVLGGLLLPRECWLLVSLTKPQVAIAMVLGIGRQRFWRAVACVALVMAISLVWFGLWPLQLLRQPAEFVYGAHNFWQGLWPFQMPAGVALVVLGLRRRDERMFLAASPFFSPYAPTSTMLGPWLAVVAWLKDWEAALVWATWWGVVAYRVFMGM